MPGLVSHNQHVNQDTGAFGSAHRPSFSSHPTTGQVFGEVHVTEDDIRGIQSLKTGTGMVPETLVYMLLKHLKWLLAQESFTHVHL